MKVIGAPAWTEGDDKIRCEYDEMEGRPYGHIFKAIAGFSSLSAQGDEVAALAFLSSLYHGEVVSPLKYMYLWRDRDL